MPDHETKVAVVGCGRWGMNHVRVMRSLGALHVACDTDRKRRAAVQAKFPDVHVVASLDEVLNDEQVRGVVVAAPAEHHHPIAKACLEAGRDVLVEKPLSLTVADGVELVQLAAEQDRVLMVGHLLRYHPAAARLKRLVREGALGRIQYIYSHRLNLGQVRSEENILWSFAPHDISLMLWLMNEQMPGVVAASGGTYLHPDIADVTVTNLEFANGVRGHIFVSWLHPFKDQRLVVVGERGMARFDDVAPAGQKLAFFAHSIDWIEGRPVPHKAEPEFVDVGPGEPLEREDQHFLDRMADRSPPLTDGREGLRVLEVLEACGRSLRDRGAPVEVIEKPKPGADYRVHPSAAVDHPVEIGAGTQIWHFSHVMKGARIGRRCVLGQNVHVAPDVQIGDGVKIQNNVSLYTGCIIEEDVFLGPSCVFTNVSTPRSEVSRKDAYETTVVRKGATIGANATVVCGHTVGRYAFVGAGAVVTRDVPAHALILGAPGRICGWMCRCGERLGLAAQPKEGARTVCESCERAFAFAEGVLAPIGAEAA